jgi:hypothetical protein
MADPKTRKNDASVHDFIASVDDPQKRNDSMALLKIFKEVLGEEPVMWGPSIVGFGSYHYRYASGREGDWMVTGFSPRKQALTLYVMAGFDDCDELLARLGKYKTGKSCLYIKQLSDVDEPTLRELIKRSAEHVAATNA